MKATLTRFLSLGLLAFAAGCDTEPVGPAGPAPVASVSVTNAAESLFVGQEIQLTATPRDADGGALERPVTWFSSANAVAAVTTTGRVSAVAVGSAEIRATSEGRTGTVTIRVVAVPPVPVAEVRIDRDDELPLAWNGGHQLAALPLDADGNVLPGRPVTWSSNRTNIATVDETGFVRAVAAGQATITATIDGVHSQLGVRVSRAPVTEVLVDAPVPGREPGDVVLYGVRLKLESGEIVAGPATWTTSNAAVATVVSNEPSVAIVTATGPGNVTITATAEGKSGSISFAVAPLPAYDLMYHKWNSSTAADIFLLRLGVPGSAPVRLDVGTMARDAAPSPDGSRFAFVTTHTDALGVVQHDLYIANRDGSNIRWVTRAEGPDGYIDQPAWSPNGTQLIFRQYGATSGSGEIWSIQTDGSGLRNLTAGLNPAMENKRDGAWSPDGSRIAFVAVVNGQHKIWTMSRDGTNAVQVTTDAGFDISPTWSPAGDKIAFVRYNGPNPSYGDDIMLVPVSGGTPTRIALPGDQRVPAWSPDGLHIAFSGTPVAGVGNPDIYTMRPDGSGLRLRTVAAGWRGGWRPAWITRQ